MFSLKKKSTWKLVGKSYGKMTEPKTKNTLMEYVYLLKEDQYGKRICDIEYLGYHDHLRNRKHATSIPIYKHVAEWLHGGRLPPEFDLEKSKTCKSYDYYPEGFNFFAHVKLDKDDPLSDRDNIIKTFFDRNVLFSFTNVYYSREDDGDTFFILCFKDEQELAFAKLSLDVVKTEVK